MRPASLLLLLALGARVALADDLDFVAPALDASGTLFLDGGAPVPDGGGVVTAYGGAGSLAGDLGVYDRQGGVAALVRPAPAIELGLGAPSMRQRPPESNLPLVDPGYLLFQVRAAAVPEFPGLALALSMTSPISPLPGVTAPAAVQPRVAYGRDFGFLHPMVNAAMSADFEGHRQTWGGAGLRLNLPFGAFTRVDVAVPLGGDWRAGGGLGVPLGPGVRLAVDAARRNRAGGAPDYEAYASFTFQAGEYGAGSPFKIDRDQDGVPNVNDACPRLAGDGPDGCPLPDQRLGRCDCPLDDLSPFESERLLDSLKVVPQGSLYVVEVRVHPVGERRLDWENTQAAVDGAREALLAAGVPKRNFVVVGRLPIAVSGVPLLTIRLMEVWRAPTYIEATEFHEPESAPEPVPTPEPVLPPEPELPPELEP